MGNSEDEVGDVIAELRMSNRLRAILATRGLETKEAIAVLNAAGMTSQQIGEVLGANPSTVRVALHRARKARGGRPGTRPPQPRMTDDEDTDGAVGPGDEDED